MFDIAAAGVQFACAAPERGPPLLLHWGATVPASDIPGFLPPLTPAAPDAPIGPSLFPVTGFGYFGEPAFEAQGASGDLFDFAIADVLRRHASLRFDLADAVAGVAAHLRYEIDEESGILISSAAVENLSDAPLDVRRLAALALELPTWATFVDFGYGSWANEGRCARLPLLAGKIERVGRSGRPGFDGGPFLIAAEEGAGQTRGRVIGFHLATSGDFLVSAERLGAGQARAILAERLGTGEALLRPGESFATPTAFAGICDGGLNELSRRFHALARRRAPQSRSKRPVQYNTWEAAYFDVCETRAKSLAKAAADLGAERFVLDDGWFKGRNSPLSSLGDWTADPEKYPNGLQPLIDYVQALGLEFGLWVEPEMISEDSDLFRSHPDWILAAPGRPRPTGRGQMVLDLTRAEVRAHLFAAVDALLSRHAISYLKWDCNRDLYPAASAGAPAARRQIEGLYDLLGRIRRAHPAVAIESCASGGGRVDFGVLEFADRFWTSDATDALERTRIQRRASVFFPCEILGAHAGPSPNPVTGRRHSMAFRALVALFGHFGFELDPAHLEPLERQTLKNAVALFKKERGWMIDATMRRLDFVPAGAEADILIAKDGGVALMRVLRLEERARPSPVRVRAPFFDDDAHYEIAEISIEGVADERETARMSGRSLGEIGVDADPHHAATGRLFRIRRTAS